MVGRLRPVTNTALHAIIYLRQSVHRDDSISLELQELACRDYCDRMGYEVITVEADPGISGRTWNRPAVQRVMAAIDTREADVIVLWKWSRLSRSRKDWALAIDRADIAGGKIESATEPIDTATASGRFARGVMTEYAAFQSEQIGEQWEEVRQRRLNLGLPVSGRLPFGWTRTPNGIAPHPEHGPIVVEMYRRYLNGEGSASIAAWLNAQGIPAPNGGAWRRPRPLSVMDSPVHAGLIPYRGATYPGQHDPIIDEATWDAYRSERTRRRDHAEKPRDYHHLLSGVMLCSCGGRMHGKGSTTAGKVYRGYLCGSTLNGHDQRAYVSAITIEPLVTDWLLALDPQVDAKPLDAAATARLAAILREQIALDAEQTTLTRQLGRELIPEAAYVRATNEITTELARLKAEENALTPPRTISPTAVITLQDTWPGMTIPEQNRGLRKVVESVTVHDSGERFTIRTVWGRDHELRGPARWRGKRRTT
ncbi:DNA invertase Pin-like site-specific DNA recombinase [Microbacterium resistens]|uniref:DNA invertase Pin-like site-specific DNA recombinase n=2 Tax=Microbacterium resistens TaxID=156977 RepID=A0ABU1SDH4_9MICO|nr:DNA invertase Pin-like site-specific DNA recombinase [Microbacterium resistens]